MEIFYAIFLGFLQGATEFLPVSSSGHLFLAEHFFQVEAASLTFDVVLHLATLTAILAYFRRDLANLLLAFFGNYGPERGPRERKIAFYICYATVPAVVVGLLWGEQFETTFRSPLLVAFSLSAAGLLLWWAEKRGSRQRSFSSLGFWDTMIIGCAQALALIPGVSRSGSTITAGLFLGLNRVAAARFSFLLSAPVICGAASYKLIKLFAGPGLENGQYLFYGVGFLSSAISGYAFISLLMRFVQTHSLAVFAYYRFFLTALVLSALALGY
jgi:undecaprenyl-diphosphatase